MTAYQKTLGRGAAAFAFVISSLACGAAGIGPQSESAWQTERRRMVDEQLRARDIRSARVLDAMLAVPRHLFVPEAAARRRLQRLSAAHRPRPDHLPAIHRRVHDPGAGRSRPSIACSRSEPDPDIRRRCSASSRRTCTRSRSCPPLAERARETLSASAIATSRCARATAIWDGPSTRRYDRIMVTAAPEEVPPALVEQLKIGGLDGDSGGTADAGTADPASHRYRDGDAATLPVRFVPMTGKPK